jgi:hypothetical protein
MNSWRRMGGFLIAIGVLFLVLFVISDSASQPEFSLLAGGFGCLVVGIFMIVTHPAPAPPPAPRFRVLNRRKGEPAPKREQPISGPAPKPSGLPAGGGKPGGPPTGGGKSSSQPSGPPGGGGKPGGGGGKPGGKPAGKK